MTATLTLSPPAAAETHSLELFLTSDLGRIGPCRHRARKFLDAYLHDTADVEDMEVIIDEALTNIMQHSCAREPGHPVQMKIVLETLNGGLLSLLSVILVDRGPHGASYKPTERVDQTRASHVLGEPAGFGLVLLYRLMDQVDYQTCPQGGNRLVLRKWFCREAGSLVELRRLMTQIRDMAPVPLAGETRFDDLWSTGRRPEAVNLVRALEAILGHPGEVA
ncbi:MAG: Histidine kinaselike ATPase domain [Cyanobacteria bacterium RYN_339]|nr:Histidine kinaselike ATPase domain [Cyanobacteria bacterium RYN_339]